MFQTKGVNNLRKKLIYIASKYTDDTEEKRLANVRAQIVAAEQITTIGAIPYIPLLSHYWDEAYPHEWEFWIEMCTQMVVRCDALIRLPGGSRGADIEVSTALMNNIPVFHSFDQLARWVNASKS